MQKVLNIKPKANSSKLANVKKLKDLLSLGLKDSLDFYNQVVDAGEFDLTTVSGPQCNKRKYSLALEVVFDCEVIDDDVQKEEDERWAPKKPDPETALAIDWMEGLSDEEKRKIDLLIIWNQCYAVAGS